VNERGLLGAVLPTPPPLSVSPPPNIVLAVAVWLLDGEVDGKTPFFLASGADFSDWSFGDTPPPGNKEGAVEAAGFCVGDDDPKMLLLGFGAAAAAAAMDTVEVEEEGEVELSVPNMSPPNGFAGASAFVSPDVPPLLRNEKLEFPVSFGVAGLSLFLSSLVIVVPPKLNVVVAEVPLEENKLLAAGCSFPPPGTTSLVSSFCSGLEVPLMEDPPKMFPPVAPPPVAPPGVLLNPEKAFDLEPNIPPLFAAELVLLVLFPKIPYVV